MWKVRARARLGEPQKVCASGARTGANLLCWGQILLRTSPTCFSGLCFLPLYFFLCWGQILGKYGLAGYIYMYITHIYAYVHVLYYIYIIYIVHYINININIYIHYIYIYIYLQIYTYTYLYVLIHIQTYFQTSVF